MTLPSSTQTRLADLLAKARAQKADSVPVPMIHLVENKSTEINSHALNSDISQSTDRFGNIITFNEQQVQFMNVATKGESCILIGAAGTGKTSCMKGVVQQLITTGYAGILHSDGHKYLTDSTPGIVAVSFTRRAVANLRRAMPDDMKGNCLTIHAILEYEPIYYSVTDETTGEARNTMRFEPTRTVDRPLPTSIRTCIIDESSMVSVELFRELQNALPSNCQFIFLGDIQQLPPVFGSAILGFKMLELPTIELVQVYRQALESPIIRLAHRILSGKPIPHDEYAEWKYPGQLTIHPWKKKLSPEIAALTISKFLTTAIEAGAYDPENDMVLIPFNKACGTIEINARVANFLARKRGAITYEIIAGFNKLYFSTGDKVLYDKEDAVIVDIKINAGYTGAAPQVSAATLDYWGFNTGEEPTTVKSDSEDSGDDIDFLLSQSVALSGEDSDRVRQASHSVTVRMADTDKEVVLDSAADLNSLLLSYALTIHKAQGSEWRKVFLMLHNSHATMLSRELLYTGVTRAKSELYIICEPDSMVKGILSQRIKGDTLAEKSEYFKGKVTTKK